MPRIPTATMFLFALVIVAVAATVPRADEGMWPLHDLDKLDLPALAARGLELPASGIDDGRGGGVAAAVVQASGGTAAFVSAQGLLLTNHHIAFSAVQRQSTVDANYLEGGFYATSRAEEIPAPGYQVYVPAGARDVTARVLAGVNEKLGDRALYEAIETAIKRIVKEAEAGGDVKCRVAKMFGGTQYVLYTRRELRDIRIVYAPPASIGKYGGDIDNWMWPRHTGDYSFLRAYVAPDGSSADFAEENVPYSPASWLPLSGRGVVEGDFSLVIGYPGRTNRYASSFQIAEMLTQTYPRMIRRLEDVLAIYEDAAAADPAVELRLASRMSGLNNYLKNSYGMVEGFDSSGILERKKREERRLTTFLREQPALRGRYGRVLPNLKEHYREKSVSAERDFVVASLGRASELYSMASRVYRWSLERQKPDLERERGYQARDEARARRRLEVAQINLLPEVDRKVLRYTLANALAMPAEQQVAAFAARFPPENEAARAERLDAFLDGLYGGTAVDDLDRRMEMFEMSTAELEDLGDPFVDLAIAIYPEAEAARERRKRFSGAETRLEPMLIAAFAAWRGDELYPDANSTQRLSYGEVLGFGPCESPAHPHLTTLSGLLAKETGADPFIVPDALRRARPLAARSRWADAAAGDVPVNFLTTNDSTGGNSGSPVLNGRGEIIGVLFDGNYESIAADYLFEAETARSIMVDIRYVLFLMDEVYGLDGLLAELTVL